MYTFTELCFFCFYLFWYSPMFRVTVMTLSDMVESVTLLKDTD